MQCRKSFFRLALALVSLQFADYVAGQMLGAVEACLPVVDRSVVDDLYGCSQGFEEASSFPFLVLLGRHVAQVDSVGVSVDLAQM